VNGRAFFATNQHVVVGNEKLQFQPLSNKISLKFGPAQAAVGHDVMVIPVQPEVPGFETSPDVSKEVSIGDAIVVLGDPEGAGVVRPITGRILGIGPNLVEVSAQFVEGNSGSPIVHVKSGKVIGVATYASMRAFDAGAGQMGVQVRRFGYRLDSVQKWQPVDWAAYQSDAATAAAGKTYTEALGALCLSIIKGTFNPVEHKDPRLKNALARFPKANATEAQMQQQTEAFVREVRNATKMQSDDLRRRLRYDYFARDVDADLQLRELMLNALDQTKGRIAPGGAPGITPARAPGRLF
jgi:serine protease Do